MPVEGWTVQLVGWNDTQVSAVTLPLGVRRHAGRGDVSDTLGIQPTFAGVIVTANDSTEKVTQYAPYSLRHNGTLLGGGS